MQRKSSYRLKLDELVTGRVEDKAEPELLPEHVDFTVLLEDELVLVISKPPGLVVHPGAGTAHSTLAHGLLHHCRSLNSVGETMRPGIVHRLDKDTSGIMIIAKTAAMHRALVDDFKNHRVEKEYLALVHGSFADIRGRIAEAIGRHPINRQKMAVRQLGGKHAVTRYTVLEELDNRFSLLRIGIETGRTHQIRVHMAHLGHPVAGDSVYGSQRDNKAFPRQLLHAWRLSFTHPERGRLTVKAPLWQDFNTMLHRLGAKFSDSEDI